VLKESPTNNCVLYSYSVSHVVYIEGHTVQLFLFQGEGERETGAQLYLGSISSRKFGSLSLFQVEVWYLESISSKKL